MQRKEAWTEDGELQGRKDKGLRLCCGRRSGQVGRDPDCEVGDRGTWSQAKISEGEWIGAKVSFQVRVWSVWRAWCRRGES